MKVKIKRFLHLSLLFLLLLIFESCGSIEKIDNMGNDVVIQTA